VRKERSVRSTSQILVLCTVLAGCLGEEAVLERRGDRPSAEEINARLREMQLVRLTGGAMLDVASGTDTLVTRVQNHCVTVVKGNGTQTPWTACTITHFSGGASCDHQLCGSQLNLCAAAMLLDIAESPTVYSFSATSIPPQSRATNAAIREQAARFARDATLMAGNALRFYKAAPGATGACDSTVGGMPGLALLTAEPTMTKVDLFAETFVEGARLADRAIEDATADNLAVAEALPSQFDGSFAAGHWAQWYGATLSFTHVAGLYVPISYPSGTFDVIEPPCSRWGADLDPAVSNAAIDLVRGAGFKHSVLANTGITPETLWTGAGLTGDESGGMRDRLAELTGDDDWSAMAFEDFLGTAELTQSEFETARARVAEQSAALSADLDAEFTPPLPPGEMGPFSYTYHAATHRPGARPIAQTTDLVAGLPSATFHAAVTAESSTGARPTQPYARMSHATFLDWAATVSAELVGLYRPTHLVAASTLSTLAGPLADVRPGRLHVGYVLTGGNTRTLTVDLYGDYLPSTLRLVYGAADAACATQGHLDGEDCTMTLMNVSTTTQTASAGTGYLTFTRTTLTPVPADTPVYLLRRRAGSAGDRPGDFEIVQAIEPDWASAAGVQKQVTFPIVPYASDTALAVTTANPESCEQNSISCAGILRTGRIPLENSLSEDGDAHESSWRHYLTLARVAADRADQLAQEWIDVGSAIDQRSEDSWERIEHECGDVGDVANQLDPLAQPGGSCTSDASCDPSRGERCEAGSCIATPSGIVGALADNDPRAARLAECLGLDGAAVLPFAALGSQPLCMWVDSAGVYCGSITGAPQCPYEMSENPLDPNNPCATKPNGTTFTLPGGYSFVPVHDTVGLSHDQWGNAANDHGDIVDTCNAIRGAWVGSGLTEGGISSSIRGILGQELLTQLASRVGWTAQPMNLSHLTVDGAPWAPRGLEDPAGTGLVEDGLEPMGDAIAPSSAWPCGGLPEGIDCAGPRANSLFCQQIDCSAPPGTALDAHRRRAQINDRMARAVLALKLTTAGNLGNFRSPFWPDHPEAGYNVDDTSDSSTLTDLSAGAEQDTLARYSHIEQASTCEAGTCVGVRHYRGDAYCNQTCTGALCPPLWSTSSISGWVDRRANCNDDNSIFVVFDPRTFDGIDPVAGFIGHRAPALRPFIWSGIVGEPAVGEEGGERGDLMHRSYTNNLYYRVLRRDGLQPDTVVLHRDAEFVEDLTLWWHRNDENDASIAGHWDQQPSSGEFARGLTVRNLNDALELACELGRSDEAACDPNSPPPEASSIRDLPAIRGYFNCVAATIEDQIDHAVLPNVPRAAVRGVSEDIGGDGFRVEQGSFGASVVQYRTALEDLRSAVPQIARELRANSRDIEQLEILLQQMELAEQTRVLQIFSQVSRSAADCGRAIGVATVETSQIFGAVMTCADSAAQIAVSIAGAQIAGQSDNLDLRSKLIDLNQRFDDRMATLSRVSREIREAVGQLESASVELASRRTTANVALAQATLADTTPTGRVLRTNTVLRRRYSTARTRYWRAFRDAQQSAYLARIAIEQHLGVDLNAINRDMTLVDRPEQWADRICQVSGIDYGRIRDERDPLFDDYADQYLGDYVTLLERFVESYRIDFPFQDGADTVVLSVRDDLAHATTSCSVESNNLIAGSGDIDVDSSTRDGEDQPLWEVEGCAEPTPGVVEPCVARVRTAVREEEAPFLSGNGLFDNRTVFTITFSPDDGDPTTSTRYTSSARITQYVHVTEGRYRLSWFVPNNGIALQVRDEVGAVLPSTSVSTHGAAPGWVRRHVIFDVPRAQRISISLVPVNPAVSTPQSYQFAAPMLEHVPMVRGTIASVVVADHPPAEYVQTDLQGMHRVPVCEDTYGDVFRANHWTRKCQELCVDGFDHSCESGQSVCYYELVFRIEAQDVANGTLFERPGFARGSYNYRIDTLGVNFVGSASRSCADSHFPDSCFNNGWIPYSLLHQGSPVVINHFGGTDYVAPIFPGRMEQARGLAAERHLSNPISSADRTLMQDYMNSELRGRPLPGTYVLRVWDAPGVAFDGIEDAQIVLNYRYWTRQE
jgi:hypothetical protein